ncbi:diaminopimelate epimerase [Porticoccaceae bacterium]|jgi:diaminopimelate epimerase|nr:diaminopimelate epimerase [Porticoccaceae bacterium]MBT6115966.1 diaminopimelate epimerase [Porticoccaceae bacterium]MBT6592422.1 diaminopimelate epimerase [Porticoccaceae bacterium]MDB4428261.1 diaminopimelate epimerase [Porticoccaceae bacterium]MDC0517498.1 diaminopimelate epimerase [Porticoccaceae bacterium]
MLMKFTKMHGLGNDFVVIDAVTQNVRITASMVRRLADRKTGIGCDQVLVIEPPSAVDIDFNYRIFNCDGAEVEQCGNGARCLARFVHDRQLTGKKSIQVQTSNRVMTLNLINKNLVAVDMGVPELDPPAIPFQATEAASLYDIDVNGQVQRIAAVSMGNPHAVLTVADINTATVAELGAALESHERFPNRVNVGFMQIVDRSEIKLRVFERGVGETDACGSGACAAAVAAIQQELVDSPVTVHLTRGPLKIDWKGSGSPLIMSGPAKTVFHGRIRI